jgi:hypothetical protein
VELLAIAMKSSEQRRHRTNNALNLIQLVAAIPYVLLAFGSNGSTAAVMFLVVTVIERHQVVKTAVVTNGVSVVFSGRAP